MQSVLKDCLLTLLETKPIEKVTITEICALAGINRGTFYAYYANPYELLAHIEGDLFDQMVAQTTRPSKLKKETIKDYFRQLFDLFYDNKELMRVLFGEFGDRKFLVKCSMLGYEGAVNDWQKKAPNVDRSYIDYIFAYVYNGCLGIVELWIKNNYRESPAEMAALIEKFFTDSLDKYFD
jgi:AcrR family transcriptional regulator